MIVKTYVFLAARYRSRRICRERFPVSLLPAQFGLACTSGMFFSDEEASPQWNQVLGTQYFLSPLSGLIFFFTAEKYLYLNLFFKERSTIRMFYSLCLFVNLRYNRHRKEAPQGPMNISSQETPCIYQLSVIPVQARQRFFRH